jgi:peroxiredoxin
LARHFIEDGPSDNAMTARPVSALREAFLRCRDMDGTLGERLSAYSDAVRRLVPDYADAIDRLVARLSASEAGASAPAVGEPMPPFTLPDEAGHLVSLDDLVERGPAAITFHRGHWCPWCRISGRAFAEIPARVARAGAQVAAIMPEREHFAAEFKAEAGSPFPVLTDLDNGYALTLNLAIWIGRDLEQLLLGFGRSLPDYQGNDAWLLPIPATFVVGTDGRVAARFIDPDFRRRVSIEDLIHALETAV